MTAAAGAALRPLRAGGPALIIGRIVHQQRMCHCLDQAA
jgi:hypothetical protein